MECRTARLLLEHHRPRGSELPADDVAALEAHLGVCTECDALARGDRRFEQRLVAVGRDVVIPVGLQDRLSNRLRADRKALLKRRLGWAARGAAVAAALLVAVFYGWDYWRSHPPALDVAGARDREWEMMDNPRGEWVEAWFVTHHKLPAHAPRDFDYAFLVHYGLAELQGRKVPHLVFVRGDTRAAVYILNDRQFDFARLPEMPGQFDTSGPHVEIRRDPDHAGTAYLILYTGGSLAPLLAAGQHPAI